MFDYLDSAFGSGPLLVEIENPMVTIHDLPMAGYLDRGNIGRIDAQPVFWNKRWIDFGHGVTVDTQARPHGIVAITILRNHPF